MRIDVTVMPSGSVSSTSSDSVHEIRVDLSGVSSAPAFFDVLAREMELPHYFGRNWDALNECLSDYVVVENGGLGSEFGDRNGIDAQLVRMVFLHVDDAVSVGLLTKFLDTLDYVHEVDQHRVRVDLEVVLEVDRPAGADELNRELARRAPLPPRTNGTFEQ